MINKCFECDSGLGIHLHHIVPRSMGGHRCIPLCYRCHGLVHNIIFVDHKRLIIKALQGKRDRGEYTGGQIPTGYKAMLNGKLQRDEKGQAIIRRIKDMRADKRTYKDIISTLSAETNKVWHYTQVYRLANRDIDYFKVCL